MEREPSTPDSFLGETLDVWVRRACTNLLTGEHDPDAIVPCSRYGRTAADVAPYAVGALIGYASAAGVENELEAQIVLEDYMRFAVNDNNSVALVITACWDSLPASLQSDFGSLEQVQELAQ